MFETYRRRRPWGLLAALAAVGALGVWAGTHPEDAWLRVTQVRALVAGAPLGALDASDAARSDSPYGASPLQVYTSAAEAAGLPRAWLADTGDAVARDVGWWMLAETGASDLAQAELALWTDKRGADIPLWIAERMRAHDLVWRRRGAGVRAPRGPTALDADQAAHVFAHVGWILDLGIAERATAEHTYLSYAPPSGVEGETWTLEAANFARVDMLGRPLPDLQPGIGTRLFIEPHFHPTGAGGIRSREGLAEAGGLFEILDDRGVSDAAVAEVAGELMRDGRTDAAHALLWQHVEGSGSPRLVHAAHTATIALARQAIEDEEADEAVARAEQAVALRRSHGPLHRRDDPEELVVLAKAKLAAGSRTGSRAVLAHALAHWRDPVEMPSRIHAEAMLLDIRGRDVGMADFNSRIIPLMNHAQRIQDEAERQALRDEVCPRAERALRDTTARLRDVLPDCAS